MKHLIIILTIIFAFALQAQAQSQIAIIANKSVKEGSVSRSTLVDIYTLNKLFWSNGSKITVVDLRGESSMKERFYDFLGFNYAQIQKLWLKRQFSGKSMPPVGCKTEKEIVEKVASTPGAIGYVSLKNVTKDVIVLVKIQPN